MAASFILFAGLLAVWCLAASGGGWSWPVIAGLGAASAALGLWAARRLRVVDAASVFAHVAQTAALVSALAPRRAIDATRVLAAMLGARARAPVFVRLKLKPSSLQGGAAVIAAMSAAPGTVVVDADAGSLLAHVLAEPDVDVAGLQRLERAALAVSGGAVK